MVNSIVLRFCIVSFFSIVGSFLCREATDGGSEAVDGAERFDSRNREAAEVVFQSAAVDPAVGFGRCHEDALENHKGNRLLQHQR